MCCSAEKYSNFQMNGEAENKSVYKIAYIKDHSISISINSQVTNNYSKNFSVKASIKNIFNKMQNYLTTILFLCTKKTLYSDRKVVSKKENRLFDTSTKKYENKESKEIKEKIENIIVDKENKIEINKNKIEFKEETKNYVNNKLINDVNKNIYSNTIENCNINKNIKKKIDINDNYTQDYNRNDFCDNPPKISKLFMDIYDYKNKNIFSHSNDTSGNIKESKKIPNIFYNHLLINKENNKRYTTTSFNKNNHGKLTTFIFYSPRNICD